MRHWTAWDLGRAVALGAGLAVLGLGCVAESSPQPLPTYSASSGGSNTSAGAVPTPTSASRPMLVDVDPDRTMTAVPGQGVGVFTEYATGGHWHVWWICDTSTSLLPCQFDVVASVASGALANVAGDGFASTDSLQQQDAQRIEAVTTTTVAASGIRFDTDATAVVTLDARLNGGEDGRFLFFVQGGVVNGNYSGTLTDPLMLEPGPAR